MDPSDSAELRALRRELARLRRGVALLALPWLVMGLVSFVGPAADEPADGVADEVIARRFVVVDDEGVVRAELGAPVVDVLRTAHAKPEPQPVPALQLHFHDGSEIRVGGAAGDFQPQVRISRDDRWSGVRLGGFFTVQHNGDLTAASTMDPWGIDLSVDREGYRRGFEVDFRGDEPRAAIVLETDDVEVVLPAR